MTSMLRADFSGRNAVYRIFDMNADLLYVGLTRDVGKRLAQHARHSPWWPSRGGVTHTAEWFACRGDAALAEAVAIILEHPRHNARRDRCRLIGARWVDLATATPPIPITCPTY